MDSISNTSFSETIYDGASNLLSSGAEQAGNALKWGLRSSYSGVYGSFKFVVENSSNAIRHIASPIIELSGNLVNLVTDNYEGENLIAAAGYGYIGYKGVSMMATPFTSKAKWIRIDDRFNSKIEIKPALFNFGDAVKKIEPVTVLQGPVAAVVAAQAKKKSDRLKAEADAALLTKDQAKKDLDAAKLALNNRLVPPALQSAFDIADKAYKDAKKAADEAKKQADKAQELAKPKKDDKSPAGAESGSMVTFKAEKTKQKPGETWINLPMSKEAIVINREEMKKEFTQLSAGVPLVMVGAIGGVNNLKPQITEYLFGPILPNIISKPGEALGYVTAKTFRWVTSNDTLGLNKLVTAGALATGAYYTIKGVKGYTNPVSGVWFKFKKGSLRETNVERTGSIIKDLTKVAIATTLVGASVLSLNDFLSGQ